MRFFFFLVCYIVTDCYWQLRFDRKLRSCIKLIHLVTGDSLYDRKAFYVVKNYFYLLFINPVTSYIEKNVIRIGKSLLLLEYYLTGKKLFKTLVLMKR